MDVQSSQRLSADVFAGYLAHGGDHTRAGVSVDGLRCALHVRRRLGTRRGYRMTVDAAFERGKRSTTAAPRQPANTPTVGRSAAYLASRRRSRRRMIRVAGVAGLAEVGHPPGRGVDHLSVPYPQLHPGGTREPQAHAGGRGEVDRRTVGADEGDRQLRLEVTLLDNEIGHLFLHEDARGVRCHDDAGSVEGAGRVRETVMVDAHDDLTGDGCPTQCRAPGADHHQRREALGAALGERHQRRPR